MTEVKKSTTKKSETKEPIKKTTTKKVKRHEELEKILKTKERKFGLF